MDSAQIRTAVVEVVLDIVHDKTPGRTALHDSDRLSADLGLKSMDLALVLADLESRLGADPFAELVSITSVRSVGDLCDAYVRFFSGATAIDASAGEGQSRADKRKTLTNE
jgi:acyl carrier protein